jgi:NAD-dependent DNA ligase
MDLLAKLKAANEAYRNTDKLLMTDEEYDRGIEELRRLRPNEPFLKQIGAMPLGKTVTLPSTMASLDKIHDSEALERWKKRVAGTSYIISEKLDGISCLYCNNGRVSMYLRGDGVKGVDVSGLVGRIKLPLHPLHPLDPSGIMVRGELVIRRSDTPAGSIGRSLINGWVHRLETATELSAVRFVAYELIQPAMSRQEQFAWLAKHFEVPWYRVVASAGLKSDYLQKMLEARRIESEYSTDGIVIADASGVSSVGSVNVEAKNPKDAIAFKVALDDQKAETVITSIEWNLSRQGMLIPTILIEPVSIGEANIGRLSGHNAALVHREKLGPGARIVVRRSGDVIPTLDTVLTRVEPSMPSQAWSWDSNNTHAMATINVGGHTKAATSKALLHALQTLEIDGVGPGLVDKLVEAGLDTLKKCMDATNLNAAGPGRGPKLLVALRSAVANASLMTLMIASNLLPRGVGERKLKLLFEVEADPAKWTFEKLCNVNGWGSIGIQDLLKLVPDVLAWCRQHKVITVVTPSPLGAPAPVPAPASKGSVVFTGVRDKDLEARMAVAGWTMSDTLTKKTSILVVADDGKESGKTKKATEYGIRIMKISEFASLC